MHTVAVLTAVAVGGAGPSPPPQVQPPPNSLVVAHFQDAPSSSSCEAPGVSHLWHEGNAERRWVHAAINATPCRGQQRLFLKKMIQKREEMELAWC